MIDEKYKIPVSRFPPAMHQWCTPIVHSSEKHAGAEVMQVRASIAPFA